MPSLLANATVYPEFYCIPRADVDAYLASAAAPPLTSPADVLRELYASEINVRFESVWDAGVHWKIGDQYNGYKGTGTAEDWDSAIFEAADYASGYYEHSGFNAWWFSGPRENYWPKEYRLIDARTGKEIK